MSPARWRPGSPLLRIPNAPPEIAATFDELQWIATSPAAALRSWEMHNQLEAVELAQ